MDKSNLWSEFFDYDYIPDKIFHEKKYYRLIMIIN